MQVFTRYLAVYFIANYPRIDHDNNYKAIASYSILDDVPYVHLHGYTSWVFTVAFSFDSKIIASGSIDDAIKLWDVTTGECLKTLCDRSCEKCVPRWGSRWRSRPFKARLAQIALINA
jgi:WD40 repeat protein